VKPQGPKWLKRPKGLKAPAALRRLRLPTIGQGSLVGRLIWLASAWSLVVLAITCLAMVAFFYAGVITRFDQGLRDVADDLFAGAAVDETGAVFAPALTDPGSLRAYSGRYWEIAEVRGGALHWLERSRSLWDSELSGPQDMSRLTLGATVKYDTKGPLKESLRAVALVRKLPGRQTAVVFLAAEDRSPIDRDVRKFGIRAAALLVLLGAGLVLMVVIQVRVGLKPLFDLRREVVAVRQGRSERVQKDYPAELAPLALELNALVAHNQEVVERQRTHVGNLAHALKTPLSVMLAEAAREGGRLSEVITRQAEAMRQQVERHLRRARAAARAQGSRDRTPVEPALEELARTLERIFDSRGVMIDWTAPSDLAFQGERQDLLEMIGNVLENACKWCRREVVAEAEALSDDRLRITVEDDGPGVPAGRHSEVLRRGARLDESAPGSGLGLSIVDELVRAYGGTIRFGQSGRGGLKVEIELPRA
jgi:signal transduction histidine kinase